MDHQSSLLFKIERRLIEGRRGSNIRAVLEHMMYTEGEIQRLMRDDQRADLIWHLRTICQRLAMRGQIGDWTYARPIHTTARALLQREEQALHADLNSPY